MSGLDKEAEIAHEVRRRIQRYAIRNHSLKDGRIGSDFGLNGSDPSEFFEEIEHHFCVSFDELLYTKTYPRKFFGLQFGSYDPEHLPDLKISEIAKFIISKQQNN